MKVLHETERCTIPSNFRTVQSFIVPIAEVL